MSPSWMRLLRRSFSRGRIRSANDLISADRKIRFGKSSASARRQLQHAWPKRRSRQSFARSFATTIRSSLWCAHTGRPALCDRRAAQRISRDGSNAAALRYQDIDRAHENPALPRAHGSERIGSFGVLALVLAAIGIYGVIDGSGRCGAGLNSAWLDRGTSRRAACPRVARSATLRCGAAFAACDTRGRPTFAGASATPADPVSEPPNSSPPPLPVLRTGMRHQYNPTLRLRAVISPNPAGNGTTRLVTLSTRERAARRPRRLLRLELLVAKWQSTRCGQLGMRRQLDGSRPIRSR